ncbi:MAG: efflux RND transporter periplasmic adaptor subunit [Rubrivivax sp.]|nr:MAG: efflux RND transporter periplasmic adaptor subunit [Rubrivivax sp.]
MLAASALGWGVGCHAESLGCLIEPDRVADVGTQVVGVLEQMKVERGDTVSAGQIVARLTAQVERASVNVAQTKSAADAEYKQAVASNQLAQRKLERTRDLVKKDFVSDQALDQADAEARVAEQRVAQAKESQRVALREYQLSAVQLGQRDVRSPFDGVVIERYRTEGERIEREPLVRVARVDPLRVEAIVPAAQFGSILAGQGALVKTDLPHFGALQAKVVLVDRVIDPASNSFRVRMTLPNPNNKIPAGLHCRVDFVVAQPVPKDAAPVVPTVLPSVPAAVSRKPGGTPPVSKRLPDPLDMSVLKKSMTEMAHALPGARFVKQDAPAGARSAVKSYLLMRQSRLSISTSLAASGTTQVQSMPSFVVPRMIAMR